MRLLRAGLPPLNRFAAWLAGLSLLAMMVVGVADILLTRLVHSPLPGAVEFSESLLVACVFLPLGWTQSRGGLIAMGFLRQRLRPTARRALDFGIGLCALGFFGVLAWQGWLLAWRSLANREFAAGLIAFPLYPGKIVLALGLSLMVGQVLLDIWAAVNPRSADH